MSNFISIITLIGSLGAGMLLAKVKVVSKFPHIGRILMVCLYGLLFFMGFRLGRNDNVVSRLGAIGALSISFAVATTSGTALVLFLGYTFLSKIKTVRAAKTDGEAESAIYPDSTGREAAAPSGITRHEPGFGGFITHLGDPLKLLALVIAGFCVGFFVPLFPVFGAERLTSYILYVLLFLVGLDMVKNGVSLKNSLNRPETILLPLGTVVGSLSGGLLLKIVLAVAGGGSYLPNIAIGKVLALSSGFGWYSLSGVIITDLGDPVLGSAGFMSNMFRESIALLAIPLIARTKFPRIGIGIAGATSMDVTLPLIERTCGPAAVPVSITSGAILSLLVPLLVPVFYNA